MKNLLVVFGLLAILVCVCVAQEPASMEANATDSDQSLGSAEFNVSTLIDVSVSTDVSASVEFDVNASIGLDLSAAFASKEDVNGSAKLLGLGIGLDI